MLAVDTNVLVRFLTVDDRKQAQRALALIRDNHVWVAKSVLLETQWVLSSLYGFGADQVGNALERLAGLPNVRVEDPKAVQQALSWFAAGLDFANALHLASCGRSDAFVTFDANFRKRAGRLTRLPVRAP